jgi:hypothetical protein
VLFVVQNGQLSRSAWQLATIFDRREQHRRTIDNPDRRNIAASICGQIGEVESEYMIAGDATEHQPDSRCPRRSAGRRPHFSVKACQVVQDGACQCW